uniref:Uncharacterized protein n=1 Tax=Micrurus spixii TaxID=129469 RepID=A0A2D4LSL0_9SAUR
MQNEEKSLSPFKECGKSKGTLIKIMLYLTIWSTCQYYWKTENIRDCRDVNNPCQTLTALFDQFQDSGCGFESFHYEMALCMHKIEDLYKTPSIVEVQICKN